MDVPTGRRWTYARVRRRHRRAGPRADRGRASRPATGSASGRRTAPSGCCCSTPPRRSARSWSTSTRPTAATSSPTCCASPASGCWSARESFKTSNYRAMIEEVRGDLAALERVIYLGTAGVGRAGGGRRPHRGAARRAGRARGGPGLRRPDQHPVHQRDHRVPQGRHAVAPQHPQQRLLHRRAAAGTPSRTGSASRCPSTTASGWCWATWPAPRTAPASSSRRPGSTRPPRLRAVQAERCTALYGVPTMFIAELGLADFAGYDLSSLRTGIMAGSPCPVEVMKRVVSEMHMTEVTICYGMTETSPVSTQTSADDDMERRVSTVGRVHPHLEVKITDPETGLVVPRGDARRAVHPRLLGHARLLGRAGQDRGGDRRGPVDAHRRPGHHGRGRLRQHRGPDQGHDHPRRRERLPARGRGVPVHPPGRGRRPGDRGAGRQVRRGAVRLGAAAPGPGPDRGRPEGLLRRARSRTSRCRGTCGSPTSSR